MSNLTVLLSYAKKAPETLPNSILFRHTATTITVFDAFPKSIFHFLILPRIAAYPELETSSLRNLRTLLANTSKESAKNVVSALADEGKAMKQEIEDEMIKRYGFKWDVWIGFHANPSMEHIHLHVLSADLCSEKMKHKKHYNSFHPKLGFFLHIEEVLSWFDSVPSYYSTLVKDFKPSKYEPILKQDLVCFACNEDMKNMPSLKKHLQDEWDVRARRASERAKRKRKPDSNEGAEGSTHENDAKDSNGGTALKKSKVNSS